jgi:hypothetical protein
VKELKQISTGLVWMSAMLAGKTTPDRATMLHSEFPIALPGAPTVRGRDQVDPLGGYPSGCRLIGGYRDLRA